MKQLLICKQEDEPLVPHACGGVDGDEVLAELWDEVAAGRHAQVGLGLEQALTEVLRGLDQDVAAVEGGQADQGFRVGVA